MKKHTRRTALIVSLAVIVCCLIGGTIAWLTDTTDQITNTFTIGKVDIDLTEQNPANKTAQMIPGSDITKDPKVTVDASSEDCYVYIQITNNAADYLDWTIANGWTALSGQTGVYYREYTKSTTGAEYPVLADNKVTVKSTLTNAQMDAAAQTPPTLAFKAYAIQKTNITDAADGWAKLNP
ncbi:MAG: SipW-dependent-type signal peptide-containing protein [Firmicutes bacterium]|nr:SipW-dependent-type signal peptide-containing protein [Bacillota bacterium]